MIIWAVLRIDGTFEGEKCHFSVASNMDKYNAYIPPNGHIKTLLTMEQYEGLKFSWNKNDEMCDKSLNSITMQIEEVPANEKVRIKQARPRKYRERLNAGGNIEKVFYDDPKSIDWSKTEIRTRT